MNCTINLIINKLSECNASIYYNNEKAKKYKNWAFLTEKTAVSASNTVLLVNDTAISYAHCLKDNNCLIVRNDVFQPEKYTSSGCSIITIDSSSDFTEVCNQLQALFEKLRTWDEDLQRVIDSKGGSQALLDVSEDIIKRPMAFITESLQIPSCTYNYKLPYSNLNEGFLGFTLPSSIVWEMRENGYIDRIFSNHSRFRMYYAEHIKINVLCRAFPDNAFMKLLVMYYCDEDSYALCSDLMDNLYEYCLLGIERKSGFSLDNLHREREELLIANALEGNITERELEAHGLMLNINPYGRYHIYVLAFNEKEETKKKFILSSIRFNLKGIKAYNYKNSLVLIEESSSINMDKHINTENYLEELLRNSGISCGVGIFTNWLNIKYGYLKAKAAAKLGYEQDNSSIIFRFRDYLLPYMLELLSERMPLNVVYMNELDRLMDYDKKHKSNYLEILKLYLQEERNVNEIARKTHLHRNSVRYRIEKIEEILHLSLDNHDNRFNLMLSLKLLDYASAESQLT